MIAYKLSAQDRRTEWIAEVTALDGWWNEHGTEVPPIALIDAALARVKEEGPKLGRTARWQRAVAFFTEELEGPEVADETHRRWVLFQGSVWLGYANLDR